MTKNMNASKKKPADGYICEANYISTPGQMIHYLDHRLSAINPKFFSIEDHTIRGKDVVVTMRLYKTTPPTKQTRTSVNAGVGATQCSTATRKYMGFRTIGTTSNRETFIPYKTVNVTPDYEDIKFTLSTELAKDYIAVHQPKPTPTPIPNGMVTRPATNTIIQHSAVLQTLLQMSQTGVSQMVVPGTQVVIKI